MQNNYKILLWILTLSLTAGFIGGCGEDSEKLSSDEITDETTAAETTIESGRESAKDTLPDDLDFGGEVVHILTRGADYDTSIELVAQELDGDVLNDAVWRRQQLGRGAAECRARHNNKRVYAAQFERVDVHEVDTRRSGRL